MEKKVVIGIGVGALALGAAAAVLFTVFTVGVLAAIAIPNFVAMQLKAKRAEVPGNVDGIRIAVLSYQAAFDELPPATGAPALPPGKAPVPWAGGPDWDTLGWSPDGAVRGVYWVERTPGGFEVVGRCDVDGDGTYAEYRADAQNNAHPVTSPDLY